MSERQTIETISINTEPISLNLMYRGRRFLTQRGKDTKKDLALEFQLGYKGDLMTEDVCLNVFFYFKDNRKRDIDSHLKALLDSMSGIVYIDDSQINELHVFKEVDKADPRVIIQIL